MSFFGALSCTFFFKNKIGQLSVTGLSNEKQSKLLHMTFSG